jgi:hypothetical protein
MFQQLSKDQFHLMHYENICCYPERELSSLMNYLGQAEDSASKALLNIDRVSKYSSEEELRQRGRENHDGWRKKVSDEEVKRGVEILQAFGLDVLYGAGPDPVKNVSIDQN